MKNYTKIRMIAMLGLVGLVATGIGNACSGFKAGSLSNSSLGHMQEGGGYNNLPPRDSEVGCNSQADFVAIAGAKTSAITNGESVLNHMVVLGSASGMQNSATNISQSTRTVFQERKSSLSKEGYVGDVNSALMMGVAAIAIEYCNDLVTYEAKGNAATRSFFTNVDLSGTTMSANQEREIFQKIAYESWARQSTVEEQNVVLEELSAMGNVNNRIKSIAICTAVMASLDGIKK